MDSVAMTAFFSHSFNTDDEALTSFLVAIAQGVDISCKNVSEGHTATPNNVAKKMITESDLFIAAITKQDKLENGKYMMSSAVRDEITMAFTLGKPSLLLVEKDVKVDGFFPQMGTYIEFERANLSNPDMLQKLVSSIHRLKVDSLSAHNILISQQQGWGDFYAENVETLIELNKDGDGFIWEYQMTRDLLFISDLKYPIKYYSWPTCQIAKIDKERPDYRVEYDYKITNSSKKFPINASQNVSTHTHDTIKFENVFDPVPVAGDRITEQISFKSPYFNPLYKEQIIGKRPDYTLDKKDFFCTEGIVATMRMKNLKVSFKVCKEYPIDPDEIVFFVGSISNDIDYAVQSEIDRMKKTKSKLGHSILIHCEIESPLLQHLYGFAWNPIPHDHIIR